MNIRNDNFQPLELLATFIIRCRKESGIFYIQVTCRWFCPFFIKSISPDIWNPNADAYKRYDEVELHPVKNQLYGEIMFTL